MDTQMWCEPREKKHLDEPSLLTTRFPMNPLAPNTVQTSPLKDERPPVPRLYAVRLDMLRLGAAPPSPGTPPPPRDEGGAEAAALAAGGTTGRPATNEEEPCSRSFVLQRTCSLQKIVVRVNQTGSADPCTRSSLRQRFKKCSELDITLGDWTRGTWSMVRDHLTCSNF